MVTSANKVQYKQIFGSTVLALLVVMPCHALDLESVRLLSQPNEPFQARIELRRNAGELHRRLRIASAPETDYDAFGMTYLPIFADLVFSVESRSAEQIELVTRADKPVPAGTVLLLTLNWKGGNMLQRVELPEADTTGTEGKVSEETSPPATEGEGLAEVPQPADVVVEPDQTLELIAIRLAKEQPFSYLQMMYGLYVHNPHAFYKKNMNNLKVGARLKVPPATTTLAYEGVAVVRAIREHYARWQEHRGHTQKARSGVGALLASLPEEVAVQTVEANTDPDELHRHLFALSGQHSVIEKQSANLRARLRAFEKKVEHLTDQVLEYPVASEVEGAAPPPSQEPAPEPIATAAEVPARQHPWLGLLGALLVLLGGAAYGWWRTAMSDVDDG